MSFPTPDELKPGNDTTQAMIAFGVTGGILTVASFVIMPSNSYNIRRSPGDPTEAQLLSLTSGVLGAGLISLGLTGILGGVRRTMPYVKFGQDDEPESTYSSYTREGTYSKYDLELFRNPDRNWLKSRGEIGVGTGILVGGIVTIVNPPAGYRGWWAVPIALTVAGIAAVAVADDSLNVVKWS
jgi:hypothetical protein